MPFSDPRQAFTDILENIDRIERFTDGLDESSFRENEQTTANALGVHSRIPRLWHALPPIR